MIMKMIMTMINDISNNNYDNDNDNNGKMIFLNCLWETLNYAEIMFCDVFDKYKPFYTVETYMLYSL